MQDIRIKYLRQFTFRIRILISAQFLKQISFLLQQSVILILSHKLALLDTEEQYIQTHSTLNKLTMEFPGLQGAHTYLRLDFLPYSALPDEVSSEDIRLAESKGNFSLLILEPEERGFY
jgi:hypothetical protein